MANAQKNGRLNEGIILAAYRSLFDPHEGVPPHLYQPAKALLRAYDQERDVVGRLMDLAAMSYEIDLLFRDNLSPLGFISQQQLDGELAWPIALARWTELLHKQAHVLLEAELLPLLYDQGFTILTMDEAMATDGDWVSDYFLEQIYPLLTPLAVDPGRPFPYISSDSLNLLVELEGGHHRTNAPRMARVKIPSITPRLIQLPGNTNNSCADNSGRSNLSRMVWSIELVRHLIGELFVDVPIRQVHCFRVLRAAEQEGSAVANGEEVHGRSARGPVVRVDVESSMPKKMFDWLVDHLVVISYSVVRFDGPEAAMSFRQLAQEAESRLRDA